MKRIAFLRSTYPNPRCEKRLDWLSTKYDTSILYWEKNNDKKDEYLRTGVRIKRKYIVGDPTNPIKRLVPYMQFRREAIRWLREEKPDIIYPEAIDMLDIACNYKKHFDRKVKIVFEVADLHRYVIDKPSGIKMKTVQNILRFFDKKDCKSVDQMVITSEPFFEIYYKQYIQKDKVLFIPNMPDLKPFASYTPKLHSGKKTIGFIGVIRYIEQMKILLKAAEEVGWHVLLAGNETGEEIKAMSDNMENVEYVGRFDFDSQVTTLYEQCDVIYSVYNADIKNVQVALPNKLYESVYCELPIIVAKGTYLAYIVGNWNVGIAVDCHSREELIKALNYLNDNMVIDSFAKNCRAHKEKINIKYYKQQLLAKIDSLVEG